VFALAFVIAITLESAQAFKPLKRRKVRKGSGQERKEKENEARKTSFSLSLSLSFDTFFEREYIRDVQRCSYLTPD